MKCLKCGEEFERLFSGEYDSLEKEMCDNCLVFKRAIGLLTEEQKVSLYEMFNGGTFDNASFDEWLGGLK